MKKFFTLVVLLVAISATAQVKPTCPLTNPASIAGTNMYVLPAWITALNFTGPADVVYGGNKYLPTTTRVRADHDGFAPGRLNQIYCTWIHAGGGTPPYTFTATGLPPGLILSPTTGQLSGVIASAGSYYMIVLQVKDSAGAVVKLAPRMIEVCWGKASCNGFGE